MLKILLMLADWERVLLRERTMEGLARAKAEGKLPGSKPKLDVEQEEACRVAFANGQTISTVAIVRGEPTDNLQGIRGSVVSEDEGAPEDD